jgi:hypothetical protein
MHFDNNIEFANDIKELSEKIGKQIADAILNDAERLYQYHENK